MRTCQRWRAQKIMSRVLMLSILLDLGLNLRKLDGTGDGGVDKEPGIER